MEDIIMKQIENFYVNIQMVGITLYAARTFHPYLVYRVPL